MFEHSTLHAPIHSPIEHDDYEDEDDDEKEAVEVDDEGADRAASFELFKGELRWVFGVHPHLFPAGPPSLVPATEIISSVS